MSQDKFVSCLWQCSKCTATGTVRVWQPDGETREQVAERHTRWCRSSCIKGCLYLATPTEAEPPQ